MIKKKSFLIIGAGKRVCEDFIPALLATKKFKIKNIFATKYKSINVNHKTYDVLPLVKLIKKNLIACDYIYIAIPPKSLNDVFNFLSLFNTQEKILIIDTPFGSIRHQRNIRFFKNYKEIYIAEDAAYLPWINAARRKCGVIKKIVFDRSGYKYHAIATAKALLGNHNFIKAQKYKNHIKIESKTLSDLGEIHIIEPRDYTKGKIEIYGSRLFLTDSHNSKKKNMWPIIKNDLCIGLNIAGEIIYFKKNEIFLIGSVNNFTSITSLTHQLKRIGLMYFLSNLCNPSKIIKSKEDCIEDVRLDESLRIFGRWVNLNKFFNFYKKCFFSNRKYK